MTVDEVPSGIYLYPEEESETDKILTPPSTRYSSDLFEEGKKDILKLMGIEVCVFFPCLIVFIDTQEANDNFFFFIPGRPPGCQNLKIKKYFCLFSCYILNTSLLRNTASQGEPSYPCCACFLSSPGPVT